MNTTITISQILGIVITVFGLSVLVNKKSIIALLDETAQSQGVLWILGFITLVSGALIITFNNMWSSGLPLFITIIGWLTFLKGMVTLVFPNFTFLIYKKWVRSNAIIFSGFLTLLIGLILLYLGFT